MWAATLLRVYILALLFLYLQLLALSCALHLRSLPWKSPHSGQPPTPTCPPPLVPTLLPNIRQYNLAVLTCGTSIFLNPPWLFTRPLVTSLASTTARTRALPSHCPVPLRGHFSARGLPYWVTQHSQGIITSPILRHMTTEDILEGLSLQRVCKVSRISPSSDTYKISLDVPTPPASLALCPGHTVRIWPAYHLSTRCYKIQHYGHSQLACKSKQAVWGRCGHPLSLTNTALELAPESLSASIARPLTLPPHPVAPNI